VTRHVSPDGPRKKAGDAPRWSFAERGRLAPAPQKPAGGHRAMAGKL